MCTHTKLKCAGVGNYRFVCLEEHLIQMPFKGQLLIYIIKSWQILQDSCNLALQGWDLEDRCFSFSLTDSQSYLKK